MSDWRLAISGFCVSLQSTVQKNGIAMKRVVFFLTFFVMSLVCFGQEESEHMKFMGIPIDGPVSLFKEQLISKGFEPINNYPLAVIGTFAGYRNCNVIIDKNDFDEASSATVFSLLQILGVFYLLFILVLREC